MLYQVFPKAVKLLVVQYLYCKNYDTVQKDELLFVFGSYVINLVTMDMPIGCN